MDGKITAPTVTALFIENPQVEYQDDDKNDHSIEYVDIAMYPDDPINKPPESLNPFWKQISDNTENLDQLLEDTHIQQTWMTDIRKIIPIFKIVRREGPNEIYQTPNGIDILRHETMFDLGPSKKPADAGDTTNEYDYLEHKALATIASIKAADQVLHPQNFPRPPQNEEPDEEWKQMMQKQYTADTGRKRYRSAPSDNAPQPKRPRQRESSMPPAKASFTPRSARRGRSAEPNAQRNQDRSRSNAPWGRQDQNYSARNPQRHDWKNHNEDPNGKPQWVHYTSEGTASAAYWKGKSKGRGKGKWHPTGHAHNRFNYVNDVGDIAPTKGQGKGKPSPVPTPTQSPTSPIRRPPARYSSIISHISYRPNEAKCPACTVETFISFRRCSDSI